MSKSPRRKRQEGEGTWLTPSMELPQRVRHPAQSLLIFSLSVTPEDFRASFGVHAPGRTILRGRACRFVPKFPGLLTRAGKYRYHVQMGAVNK